MIVLLVWRWPSCYYPLVADFTLWGLRRFDMTADVAKRVLAVVDKGLVGGMGVPVPGKMCVEAAEGIDWVWEHRIDDLAQFGL